MARSCAAWHKSVKEIAQKKKSENWKPETLKTMCSGAACAKTTPRLVIPNPVYRRGICFVPARTERIPRAITLHLRNDNSLGILEITPLSNRSQNFHRSRRSCIFTSRVGLTQIQIGKLKTQDHKNENRIGLRWGIRHFVRAAHSAAVCRGAVEVRRRSHHPQRQSLDSGQGPFHGPGGSSAGRPDRGSWLQRRRR